MVTLAPATRTTTVAFVSRINLASVDVFNMQKPPQGNPKNLTYADLWCDSLVQKYTKATCRAIAVPGSVNVDSVLGFPADPTDTTNSAISQAATLTSNLQQIVANPSLASNLIPVAAFGGIVVSGIQVTAAAPGEAFQHHSAFCVGLMLEQLEQLACGMT